MKAQVWLDEFFALNAEAMPNPSGRQAVHNLPPNTMKKDVYNAYVAWCDMVEDKPLSQPSLLRLWRAEFPHVKNPEKGRFKSCTTCVRLTARKKAAITDEEKAAVRAEKKRHFALVDAERKEAQRRQTIAETMPEK